MLACEPPRDPSGRRADSHVPDAHDPRLAGACLQSISTRPDVCTLFRMYPNETDAKHLVAELCKLFYDQGWVSGTGGGISIRCSVADSDFNQLVMAPSGVQKERMRPADMFVVDMKGEIVHTPEQRPPPYKPPKLSECSPLFMLVRFLQVA